MKANEAPERLYLSKNIYSTFLYQVPDLDDETAVEYISIDAFIEKACEWLFNQANFYTKVSIDPNNGGIHTDFYADKFVDDFKKAMKGE